MAERISPKGAVSDTLPPRSDLKGVKTDFNLRCKMIFGDYTQVYEQTGNKMTERTVGAICL